MDHLKGNNFTMDLNEITEMQAWDGIIKGASTPSRVLFRKLWQYSKAQ